MSAKREEYYLLLGGETSGPHTLEELHQMWLDEKITLDTLFVQPGMKGCRPVNVILNKVIAYQKQAPTKALPPPDLIEAETELKEARNLRGVYVLAAIGLGALIWLLTAVSKPGQDDSGALNADVEVSITHLTVFNRSGFDWQDKTVVINGKPPNGFQYKIRSLKLNQSVAISLTDFTDGAGNRFTPWGLRVEGAWIGDEKRGYLPFTPSASGGNSIPPPSR